MPITLAELKHRLEQLLAGLDPTNSAHLSEKLTEFLQYSIENYDQLDADAKSYIDQVFERLHGAAQTIADKLPDGSQKRQLLRQMGLAGGGHFAAEGLIQMLESPPVFEHPILPAARGIFSRLLQNTLDILFDATRHTHQGVANFAKVGLCYWAVDELLVATHLAQRAFANQSYAHIRTVFEILDLVELFDEQPDWAILWGTGNDKEVWSELKPSAVRKKLGEPKFDPMYSFFSKLGSHGTFLGLRARSGRVVTKGEEDRKRFKI